MKIAMSPLFFVLFTVLLNVHLADCQVKSPAFIARVETDEAIHEVVQEVSKLNSISEEKRAECHVDTCPANQNCKVVRSEIKCICKPGFKGDQCVKDDSQITEPTLIYEAEGDEIVHEVVKKIEKLILKTNEKPLGEFLKKIWYADKLSKTDSEIGIWKVTSKHFSPLDEVEAKYKSILERDFHIKWDDLSLENMEIPLYNGIVIGIFIDSKYGDEGYADNAKQADIWANIYGRRRHHKQIFETRINSYKCTSSYCKNDGICYMVGEEAKCKCDVKFTGETCSELAPNCDNVKCGNDGQCIQAIGDVKPARCDCIKNFVGRHCTIGMNLCKPNPCENLGECYQDDVSFSCQCSSPYKGDKCEQIVQCDVNSCPGNRNCEVVNSAIKCSCKPGFKGEQCVRDETQIIDPILIYGADGEEVVHEVVKKVEEVISKTDEKPIGEFLKKIAFAMGWKYKKTDLEKGIWKITEDLLSELNTNDVQTKYEAKIKKNLQIDWAELKLENMEIPLYNGIAAGILIDSKSEIGGYKSNEDQVKLWAKIFKVGDVDAEKKFKTDIDSYKCIECKHDGICYMLGSSGTCNCKLPYFGKDCSTESTTCLFADCGRYGKCVKSSESRKPARCDCFDNRVGQHCRIKMNLCHPNPCQNNGTCSSDDESFTCECPYQYRGEKCEVKVGVNVCEDYCLNGGTCSLDANGNPKCKCKIHDEDPICDKVKCKCENGGHCKKDDTSGSISCECNDGFTGNLCQNKAVDDACKDYCMNGGSCSLNEGGNPVCKCKFTHEGPQCNEKVKCNTNLCKNGGHCQKDPNSELISCKCKHEFYGNLCEKVGVNVCEDYCLNGGTCSIDANGNPKCKCEIHNVDPICDKVECKCENGGQCKKDNTSGSITCECKNGFTGNLCQNKAVDDACKDYCMNEGNCSLNEDGNPVCECKFTHEGPQCDKKVECSSQPCKNKGKCVVNKDSDFINCVCEPGFIGNLCEKDESKETSKTNSSARFSPMLFFYIVTVVFSLINGNIAFTQLYI